MMPLFGSLNPRTKFSSIKRYESLLYPLKLFHVLYIQMALSLVFSIMALYERETPFFFIIIIS